MEFERVAVGDRLGDGWGAGLAAADQAGGEAVQESGQEPPAAESGSAGQALEDLGLDGEADGQAGPLDVFGGAAAAVDLEQVASVALEVHAQVGAGGLVVAAGHLVEHVAFWRQEGDAAVGGQQPGQGFGGGVVDQPPGQWGHDEVGGLGGPGDRLGLAFLLLVGRGFAGGGFGVSRGLVGDAPQGHGFGHGREGGCGLLALELRDWAGEGGEDAALAGAGVHPDGHEQAQGFLPAGAGLDLDGAGGDGGEDGQGEHAGQIWWGLGGGGHGGHVLAEPGWEGVNRELGQVAGRFEGDGRRPTVTVEAGGGVGQLAGEVGQDGRVGVGVGQADAQVDDSPSPSCFSD